MVKDGRHFFLSAFLPGSFVCLTVPVFVLRINKNPQTVFFKTFCGFWLWHFIASGFADFCLFLNFYTSPEDIKLLKFKKAGVPAPRGCLFTY
nr:MAG TPA: hypothetical protein [Inoviridae sp.]